MAEQHADRLQAEVREALLDVHAGIETSPFDVDWASARAILDAHHRRERATLRSPRFRYRPQAWTALSALGVLALATAVTLWPAPEPEPNQSPLTSAVPAQPDPALPLMWYAPTDELLHVSSLRYAARPAALTVYDPIHLEVRP